MKGKGFQVEYVEPKEGRLALNCGFSLFAGTENRHHAHQYVDARASPESALWLVNNYAYGHSNTKIDLDQVDPALVSAFELRGSVGHRRAEGAHPQVPPAPERLRQGLAGGQGGLAQRAEQDAAEVEPARSSVMGRRARVIRA
jgi:hypothetical protein